MRVSSEVRNHFNSSKLTLIPASARFLANSQRSLIHELRPALYVAKRALSNGILSDFATLAGQIEGNRIFY